MTEEKLNNLLVRYLGGTLTDDETEELILLTNEAEENVLIQALKQNWEQAEAKEAVFSKEETEAMFRNILKHQKTQGKAIFIFRKKWTYAAAIAAMLLVGFFILYRRDKPINEPAVVQTNKPLQDVQPGTDKAILVLGNGKKIVLDSAGRGLIAAEGTDKIVKTGDGISYVPGEELTTVFNTIQTPRGGEFFVALSDGTKVWLNAASSLRYPTKFTGDERKVELTGEAYFEVARNEKLPFRVVVAGKGQVDVLGTHFNINAYDDEDQLSTTLIEGKVKFSAVKEPDEAVILTPGQQSQLSNNGKLRIVSRVNTEEIVAWKDGRFYFESADLKTILRQFKRWYNIDVVYEGAISNRKYFAVISRNSTLSQVLKTLQANEINYRIEGNKLIVQAGH